MLFYSALTFLSVAVLLYIYFVCIAIVHVVVRTETDQDITHTKTRIATLEERYMSAATGMTLEEAAASGFVETKDKVFVRRTADTLVLSSNDES
jgi:hypothetical protein